VSASVKLPLHHKVQKFSSGTGSPGWSQKKGRKTVVVVVVFKHFSMWIKCHFRSRWLEYLHCYSIKINLFTSL